MLAHGVFSDLDRIGSTEWPSHVVGCVSEGLVFVWIVQVGEQLGLVHRGMGMRTPNAIGPGEAVRSLPVQLLQVLEFWSVAGSMFGTGKQFELVRRRSESRCGKD